MGNTEDSDAEVDALDELVAQDHLVEDSLDSWDRHTATLREGDDVDVRWQRGSATKLLLQHLAVREAAKQDVIERLREVDGTELADRLEGDGETRRRAIARLDEEARGTQAMNLNVPEVDRTVLQVRDVVRPELRSDRDLHDEIRRRLGPAEESGLPSPSSVRRRTSMHPDASGEFHRHSGPVQAVRGLYERLRSAPSGLSEPGVDESREHRPDHEP